MVNYVENHRTSFANLPSYHSMSIFGMFVSLSGFDGGLWKLLGGQRNGPDILQIRVSSAVKPWHRMAPHGARWPRASMPVPMGPAFWQQQNPVARRRMSTDVNMELLRKKMAIPSGRFWNILKACFPSPSPLLHPELCLRFGHPRNMKGRAVMVGSYNVCTRWSILEYVVLGHSIYVIVSDDTLGSHIHTHRHETACPLNIRHAMPWRNTRLFCVRSAKESRD